MHSCPAGVCIFFQTVFTVLGIQLFRGSMGVCTDPTITLKELCVPAGPPPPPPPWMITHCAVWGRLDPSCPSSPPPSPSPSMPVPLLPPPVQPPNPSLPPPSPPPSPAVGCEDDPNYVEDGWSCDIWEGLPCRIGFAPVNTPEKIERLILSCPESCGDVTPQCLPRHRLDDASNVTRSAAKRHLKGGATSKSTNADQANLPISWLNPVVGSFDNYFSASLVLFVAATGDGWEDIMFAGMDVVGPGIAPERNDHSPYSLFFISWLIIGTFTMMNLFVGVTVDNFVKVRGAMDGSGTMTKEQKQWAQTIKEGYRTQVTKKMQAPEDGCFLTLRLKLYAIVTSREFEIFILGIICANTLLMAMHFYGIEQDPFYSFIYENGGVAFSLIYYAEATCKLASFGVFGYFGDAWNRFDFTLVCVSLVDQFASSLMEFLPIPPMLLRVLRLLRLLRIMRMLKSFKGLRDLLMTLVFSFPSFVNVGGLVLLFTFIYAVLGVQLFTFVMQGDFLNEHHGNFLTLSRAYMLMLQCLTLDNWSGLMRDAMVGPERGCDPDAVPTNCGSTIAAPFFISYIILGGFVLMNLVVAVILENFSSLGDINPDLVSSMDIAEFGDRWALYDKDADGVLYPEQVAQVVINTPPPLGLQGIADIGQARDVIAQLDLVEDVRGQLTFTQVVEQLVAHNYKIKDVVVDEELGKSFRKRILEEVKGVAGTNGNRNAMSEDTDRRPLVKPEDRLPQTTAGLLSDNTVSTTAHLSRPIPLHTTPSDTSSPSSDLGERQRMKAKRSTYETGTSHEFNGGLSSRSSIPGAVDMPKSPAALPAFATHIAFPEANAADVYEGDIINSVPHGDGICMYANGARYEGNWEQGIRTGVGQLRDEYNSTYCGCFVDGMPNDPLGTWEYCDGSTYCGGVVDGCRHGSGFYQWPDKTSYEGEWYDDQRSGVGVETSSDGMSKYMGTWKNNQRHGDGRHVIIRSDGMSVSYEGEWQDGTLRGAVRVLQGNCSPIQQGGGGHIEPEGEDLV